MTPAFTYDHPKRIAGANRERRLYVEVAPRQFLTHLIDAVLHALTSRYHHLTLTVAARACRRSAAALFRALTQRTLARRRCAIRTRATARARARRQSQADSWCRHANAVSFPCGRARERAPATAPVARSPGRSTPCGPRRPQPCDHRSAGRSNCRCSSVPRRR